MERERERESENFEVMLFVSFSSLWVGKHRNFSHRCSTVYKWVERALYFTILKGALQYIVGRE